MRSSTTLVSALIAVLLAGCGSGGGDASNGTSADNSKSKNSFTIAVIPKGSTHEYWKSVHEGADTAASELKAKGIDVNIEWKGPMKEDDKDSQIEVVENFTQDKVSGMVLAPLDHAALVTPVSEATKAGIPVVVIDSALDGGGFLATISTDNEKGGEIAGQELGKELNGKGRVVMLRYEVGSASTEQREKGFLEAIAKYPGITVVSKDQYGGVTAESAQTQAENLIGPHKKGDGLDIDGIYTPNESTTLGMLRALEGANLAGKVHFVGFDASELLIDALKKGEINALVIQNPRAMGHDGVMAIVNDLQGNKSAVKDEDTGVTLLTKANLNQPDVQKLIAPPKE